MRKEPTKAKFLLIYRRGGDSANKMTPEEIEQNMERWHKWIGEGLQRGWLLERGDPLTQEGRVVTAKRVVLDGPPSCRLSREEMRFARFYQAISSG